MHGAHEQVIQTDIGHAGHGDEVHGAFGVAQATEDGADDIIGGDKGDADEADSQISRRARDRLGGSGHDVHNRMHQQDQHHRERHRQGEEQGDRVADMDSRPLFVVGAHRLTNADGGAHGQAYDHDGEHMHDLRADGDSSSAGCPLELTDDEQVRHAIQGLQEIGQQIRQGEKHNILKHTSCCEVLFHRLTSP